MSNPKYTTKDMPKLSDRPGPDINIAFLNVGPEVQFIVHTGAVATTYNILFRGKLSTPEISVSHLQQAIINAGNYGKGT